MAVVPGMLDAGGGVILNLGSWISRHDAAFVHGTVLDVASGQCSPCAR